MEWQKIETAPRDGRWLRVSMRDVNREPPEWIARSDEYTEYIGRGQFRREIIREIWVDEDEKICGPTHWMPLPKAPDGN